jgi:hypothetical protein
MRRLAAVLAAALMAATPVLAQKDPVDPPQGQPQRPQARPQGGPTIAPTGWRREVNQTGTVYFYCASNNCQQGDVVSYRVQQDGQRWSIDQFRTQQQRANESMLRDNTVRNVQMSGPRDESHEGTVVYVVEKDLVEGNGRATAMMSMYIAFDRQHLTLVSTAPSLSQAADNVRPFRSALIDWLRGGGR